MPVAPNDAVLETGLVIDTQRDDRPAPEYRLDSGKAKRLFPPESQAAVRQCEHTVHTAKVKSSSEPPKEIAARRVAPADLAVQLELVVVHLQHEGGVFLCFEPRSLYHGITFGFRLV